MRVSPLITLAVAIFLSIPLAKVLGDDSKPLPPKEVKPKPAQPKAGEKDEDDLKKKKISFEDVTKRAYKAARNFEDQQIIAVTIIKGWDADQDETILCIAEFKSGASFFFIGDRDGNDKLVLLEKPTVKLVTDILKRSEDRYK